MKYVLYDSLRLTKQYTTNASTKKRVAQYTGRPMRGPNEEGCPAGEHLALDGAATQPAAIRVLHPLSVYFLSYCYRTRRVW